MFADCGFEVEDFGNSTVIVRCSPQYIPAAEICDCITEMADYIAQGKNDIFTEKMEWFYGIKRLFGLKKIKKTARGFVTSDQEIWLGNTLQDASAFCINENSQQYNLITELLQENPETKRPEHLKPKTV